MLRFLDLVNDAERILGCQQRSTEAAPSARWEDACGVVNDGLQILVASYKAKGQLPEWTRRKFAVKTEGALTTGTAVVTSGSDAVTLTLDYTENLVGRRISFSGYSQVYTIESGTGKSEPLRMSPPFSGTSDDESGYTIYEPRLIFPNRLCLLPEPLWKESPTQEIFSVPDGVSNMSSFRDSSAAGQPMFYTVVEPQDRAFATNSITATAGSGTGTLGTAGDSSYRWRWFYLEGEESQLYEVIRVDGTTVHFRPKYSGSLAGSQTAIVIDPPGSPVIQLAWYPTTSEVINRDIHVYLPRYGHVADIVPIPVELRLVLQTCFRYVASQSPLNPAPKADEVESLGNRMAAELNATAAGGTRIERPPVVRLGAYMPGQRSWPFPIQVDPRVVSTS